MPAEPASPAPERATAPIAFTDDPGRKSFRTGTHRLVDPAETWSRIRPLLPGMGITRVANITGLDRLGIPVALAFRPNARSLAVTQGKGISVEAAKVSAAMETIEHYHAETIAAPLRYGRYEDVQNDCRVVRVEGLPALAGRTFDARLPMLWIEGCDLLQHEPVWVPYDMVSTNFTLPFPPGHGCFQANSNGLASGNHPLEAISQGICEVVERDALALWHLGSDDARDAARLDLASIDDGACCGVLASYRAAGLDTTVWDLTSDAGIPSFRCTIAESTRDALHVGYTAQGMGCHPSRSIALLRALTEAAQSRLTYIAGSRDDVFRDTYARLRDPERSRRRLLELRPGAGARDFRSLPDWNAGTFEADVNWELDRLRAIGVERVVVVDLSRPQPGIPVVKVVIPGLEGFVFDAAYAPGARARRRQQGSA